MTDEKTALIVKLTQKSYIMNNCAKTLSYIKDINILINMYK
jgi:hypothetical protein